MGPTSRSKHSKKRCKNEVGEKCEKSGKKKRKNAPTIIDFSSEGAQGELGEPTDGTCWIAQAPQGGSRARSKD